MKSQIERSVLLPYKYKTNQIDFSKNIPFFFIYNYNFNHFNSLLYNSYKKTCLNYSFLNNFKLQFINNIEKNLNIIFVQNFKLSFPTLYDKNRFCLSPIPVLFLSRPSSIPVPSQFHTT